MKHVSEGENYFSSESLGPRSSAFWKMLRRTERLLGISKIIAEVNKIFFAENYEARFCVLAKLNCFMNFTIEE